MGNRCVITTEENFKNNGVGVYMHWNGGRDSVEPILDYCAMKGYRSPDGDCYGWARLCQVIGNALGGTNSVGIDTVNHLDCDNGDNGVYIIKGWKIVDRKYFDWEEQHEYDPQEMIRGIDESMPEKERLGDDFLNAEIMPREMLCIGDKVIVYDELWGQYNEYEVVGIGEDRVLNGDNVKGIPYVNKWEDDPESNINNYLRDEQYRVVRVAQPEEVGQVALDIG